MPIQLGLFLVIDLVIYNLPKSDYIKGLPFAFSHGGVYLMGI